MEMVERNGQMMAIKEQKKQDVRTIANKMVRAGHELIDVAMDVLQMDNDGVCDVTAVMVEISGEDYKIRYIYDN